MLTPAGMDFSRRLEIIYDELLALIDRAKPDALAVEKLYFKTTRRRLSMWPQARGVILLAAKKRGVPLYEYTPLQVKSAVTGYGQAEKPQVMEMTRRLLRAAGGPETRRYRRCPGYCHLPRADGGHGPQAQHRRRAADMMEEKRSQDMYYSVRGDLIHADPKMAVIECGRGGL